MTRAIAAAMALSLLACGRPEATVGSHALGAEPWVWQPSPADVEIVVGNRGMGKSHAARIRTAHVRRLLAWDPMRDEELAGGRVTVAQLEELEEYFSSHPVQRGFYQGVLRLAVRPTAWDDRELADQFDRTCRVAYRVGGLCLKVDELGTAIGPPPTPPPGAFRRLIGEGRHRGVSLVLVTHRFAQIPVLARDNATRIVVFRQAGPDDADDLVDRVGELGARVRTLPERHFLEWTPTDGARLRPPLGPMKEQGQ